MSIASFAEIFADLDLKRSTWLQKPVAIVAAGGADETVLTALSEAVRRNWVQAIVTGRTTDIQEIAEQNQVDLSSIEVVDSDQPARSAVDLVRADRAQIMMKGQVSTPDLMRAVLDKEFGLKTDETICQVVLVELPHKNRSMILADTGICINPSIEQKIEIMTAATRCAIRLGSAKPRVALMAATEKTTDAMPETVDADEISRRFSDHDDPVTSVELPDCFIQGPLSFDLAFDDSAGASKSIDGPVVGRADVMIFPNLVSANLTVKAMMYTAQCKFGGILCGTRCPVVFMSRSDTAKTRLRSLALALRLVDDAK